MKIGIVGHEAAKFTATQQQSARELIHALLSLDDCILVSGRCHLGGIDVWAEEIADALNREKQIYPPATRRWHNGYKPRNIQIAKHSDIVHVIVVAQLPDNYTGLRFLDGCYHCNAARPAHVKSGACWTANYAKTHFGKAAIWHILP